MQRIINNRSLANTFGPHGAVIGRKAQDAKASPIEDLLRTPGFVTTVLEKMVAMETIPARWTSKGQAALWEVLAELQDRDEPPWLAELYYDWLELRSLLDCSSTEENDLQKDETPSEEQPEPAEADDTVSDELHPFEYWACWFDMAAAERERLHGLDFQPKERTWWDWSMTDLDLFTAVTSANLGVYWELTFIDDCMAPESQQL